MYDGDICNSSFLTGVVHLNAWPKNGSNWIPNHWDEKHEAWFYILLFRKKKVV